MGRLLDAARVAQILRGAREIVAERWIKNAFVADRATRATKDDLFSSETLFYIPDEDNDEWGYCGDGALRRALKNELKNWNDVTKNKAWSLLHGAHKALSEQIRQRRPDLVVCEPPDRPQERIWCFNDLEETSREDILAVFDDAIEAQCAIVQRKARVA